MKKTIITVATMVLVDIVVIIRPVGRGVQQVPPDTHTHTHTHRRQRSTFLLISDLKRIKVGVLFYYNYLLTVYSKIENAVKEVTSLTYPFH